MNMHPSPVIYTTSDALLGGFGPKMWCDPRIFLESDPMECHSPSDDVSLPTAEALRREQERLDTIRTIVDDVARQIENRMLTEQQARDLVATVRFQMSLMIPNEMDTYDLIYGARFERLIRQFIRGES